MLGFKNALKNVKDAEPSVARSSRNSVFHSRNSIMLPLLNTRISLSKKNIKTKKKVNETNENSDSSEERKTKLRNLLPQSPNLKLVYIPKQEIARTESKLKMFRSFSSFEGVADFEKKAKELFPDDLKGIRGKLEHNRNSTSSYMSFYSSRHERNRSEVTTQISEWNRREKAMPKVKVIPKKNFKNINLANLKEELKQRQETLKNGSRVQTLAQREKKIKTYSLLWEEHTNGFPLESREGCSFTLESG